MTASSQGNGRYTLQRAGRKQDEKRWGILWIVVCLLLMFHTMLLLGMQSQLKSMNKTLNQVLAKMLQVSEENDVINQEYYSADESSKANQKFDVVSPSTVQEGITDYVEQCGLPEVAKPVKRTEAEVLRYLEALAKDDKVIAGICENSAAYPVKMLEALANNPEMADFVEGYLSLDARPEKKLTETEKEQDYPLFLQWDPRWGYEEYGDNSNIGLAGCGPTCLSMVLYYLLGDETLTPDKIAKYSMDNGYYMFGTGTAWALLEDIAGAYGVKVTQPKASENLMKKELDQGNILICSMGPGDFTVSGHFIVIYRYDSEGFQVNDPNCVARSREKWAFSQIGGQIKHMWVFSALFQN